MEQKYQDETRRDEAGEERPSRVQQLSTLSEIAGGILVAASGLALFTVLNEREFEIVSPFAVLGFFLLVFGLPAYYWSGHHRVGRLAWGSFWAMAVGTVVAAISLPIAEYGPGVFFIGFLLGLLVTTLGAVGYGITMLRADVAPKAAAWLLIAALPVGVPLTIAFTTYVMGEGADPWGGAMVFYGLAWIVFGRYLWNRRTGDERRIEEPATEPTVQ
ncbi:hypothetical protein [Halobaculum limi]|uniref:hypothetical protein n=1 Tax=Halobaculum limi TaxID=3031916 RepID=UPI002405B08D|nr:hypothetical protein [Halobaculum sp. YSMS11]